MTKSSLTPQNQVFWYLNKSTSTSLRKNIKTDVVVVGGGIAGLSAAQSFQDKGYSVVVLEKNFCGSGASGKSSGFITPDSEFNLDHFTQRFGDTKAQMLWEFVLSGVRLIERNIQTFSIDCDYQIQDTLVVANSQLACNTLLSDHQTRQRLSYNSVWFNKEKITEQVKSLHYHGGISYSGTFGIHAYSYCQAMKRQLESQGVIIFEETPAIAINSKGVETFHANIKAEHIIVCIDRFAPDLKRLNNDIYHAQTFLMISAPLSDDEVTQIFPQKRFMVWDTDLIYQYYRITGDNRFMIGGSNLMSIFWGKEIHNSSTMFKKLYNYTQRNFPEITIDFEYFWPGLIGITKDIMPLADFDQQISNIYYISGAAGLPWAAALGKYAAEKIITKDNSYDEFFSSKRKFPINNVLQNFLGKRASFALSNLIALYR